MKYFILLTVCFCAKLNGQNLVPNPSFEEVNSEVDRNTCGDYVFDEKIRNWFAPPKSSPMLISPGHRERAALSPQARTGENSTCISTDRTKWEINNNIEYKIEGEYVGVKLTQKMIPFRTYYAEYWIRRVQSKNPKKDKNEMLNKKYGILLTADSILTKKEGFIIGQPQVIPDSPILISTEKWEKISTYITPDQDLNYLYIGQFNSKDNELEDIMTGFYVIDDVSIVEVSDFSKIDKNIELPIGSTIPLKNLNFYSGSIILADEQSYDILNILIKYLKDNNSLRIRINGHTDSEGSDPENLTLSQNRAKVIADYLIQHGISTERVQSKGFGEKYPIADNKSKEGRLKNRRVEFEIIE